MHFDLKMVREPIKKKKSLVLLANHRLKTRKPAFETDLMHSVGTLLSFAVSDSNLVSEREPQERSCLRAVQPMP